MAHTRVEAVCLLSRLTVASPHKGLAGLLRAASMHTRVLLMLRLSQSGLTRGLAKGNICSILWQRFSH